MSRRRRWLAAALPDFPWDTLEPFKKVAQAHPDGIVDLSVGTPVDPTPDPGARRRSRRRRTPPATRRPWGTPDLREAVAGWFARRRGVPGVDPDGVLPTMGSKELVAWLPTLLGLGVDDVVGIPAVAYPTYDVGARLAGRRRWWSPVARGLGPQTTATRRSCCGSTVPSNPTGAVLGAAAPAPRSSRGPAPTTSWWRRDECYAELDWRSRSWPRCRASSTPRSAAGATSGLLAVYSLSKQSNLAGYRAAFVAGDVALVRRTARGAQARRHDRARGRSSAPWPPPSATTPTSTAAEAAVRVATRPRCGDVWSGPGSGSTHSEAGLYLWSTTGERTAGRASPSLADRGVLVAPGTFYGAAGAQHVRVALTATDERIEAAGSRLAAAS